MFELKMGNWCSEYIIERWKRFQFSIKFSLTPEQFLCQAILSESLPSLTVSAFF